MIASMMIPLAEYMAMNRSGERLAFGGLR